MPEQRQSSRKRSYKAAYVCAVDGAAPVFCLVRDMSTWGARIGFVDGATVPATLDLHIGGKNRVYRAEVVWRRPAEVGVRFTAKALAPDVSRLSRAS